MKSKLMQAFASLSRAVPQRLSFNGMGLKYITTAVMGGNAAVVAKFETVKTSVWWDIENCTVPKSCDGHEIALNISSELQKMKYTGPLTIHAYGNTKIIPSSVQQALTSTGVLLSHVPAGVKDGSDKKIIEDMLLWTRENLVPANIMLISGDGDFSDLLQKLQMKGYNILLVRPNSASRSLIAAANKVLLWNTVTGSGSGSKVTPLQAEPSKQMNSNSGVEKLKSEICKVAGSGSMIPSQGETNKQVKSDLGVEKKKSPSFFEPIKQMISDWRVEKNKSPSFCEICKVDFTSLAHFNSHLSSKKHKKKAELVASQNANVSDLTKPDEKKPKTLFCSVCKVHCPKATYEEHISGRKHKSKLKEVQAMSDKLNNKKT